MTQTIHDRLRAARHTATQIGIPARRKDADLYRLLAVCLSVCEDVDSDGLQEELRAAVAVSVDERNPDIWGNGRAESNNGKGRRYVEKGSDSYILVSRFVLEKVDSRNSIYRYAAALREAGRRNIRSHDLPDWLTENGGVRSLTKYGMSIKGDTALHAVMRALTRAIQIADESDQPAADLRALLADQVAVVAIARGD
jgi:hypothetical protein